MSNRNLFTGLVRHENDVTELLVNLMQQKFFRDICLRWLLKEFIACPRTIESLLNKIEAKHIRTQLRSTEAGIPDIVIRSDNCHFLIENKIHFNTDLTKNQGNGYESIFDDNARYKGLLFLIPRKYSHLNSINGVMEKFKNDKIKIEFAYWNDLLSYLYKQEVVEVADCYKDAMIQMETVIDNMTVFDTRLTPYETAMLYSPQIVRAVFNRSSYILKITKEYLKDKGSLESREARNDKFGIGYSYKYEKVNRFIGLGPSVSNPDCFFAYSFESDKPVNGIRSELDETTGTYWNYYPIKIEDLDNIEKSCLTNAIDAVVNKKDLTSVTNIEDDGVLLKMEMDTRATYSLADKILELANVFIESKKETVHSRIKDNSGIGIYFRERNYFIGYGPNVNTDKYTLYVAVYNKNDNASTNTSIKGINGVEPKVECYCMADFDDNKNRDGTWYLFPIDKSCLLYDDLKTQQEMFIASASKAFELAESAKDNGVFNLSVQTE